MRPLVPNTRCSPCLAVGMSDSERPFGRAWFRQSWPLLLLFAVGTETGRSAIDGGFRAVAVAPPSWDNFSGGFRKAHRRHCTGVLVLFLIDGHFAVRVAQAKTEHLPRVYKVPAFPIPPILFCGMCLYMLWSAVAYAGTMTLVWINTGTLPQCPSYLIGRCHPEAGQNEKLTRKVATGRQTATFS